MTQPNQDAVVIGYCHGEQIKGRFHAALIDLLIYDSATSRRTAFGGGGVIALESSVNIASTRNEICRRFLADSTAAWLWMVDTDMTFKPDILDRLLEHADPDKAPIVGGLCFGTENGMLFPTLYDLTGTQDNLQAVRYTEWPPDAMMQVFATGAACLLIHRRALEAVRDFEHPDRPGKRGFSDTWPWFQETDFYGRTMGEDITFCARAGYAGIPVHVNTAVQLGHIKPHTLTMQAYLTQRALLAHGRQETGSEVR